MNILLVDSTPETLKESRENLSILGYECAVVSSAADAGQAATKLQPALVIISCQAPLEGPAILADLQKTLPTALFVLWSEKPKVAQILQALNNHHIHAFWQERPDLRSIMVWAADAEKKGGENFQEREAQHSRLVLEYAKLKQAYDDMRGGT